ncbi:hypothetical protein AQS8620_02301 [Aquimixticola soesokkakensis]|uniref:Phytase-like domain-containing protein n=1 Tax=Aquimixticola soesokkakensis TaxID=1519096 RepID=A0A1Y5T0B4_9RHOB|nr:esterase-like activity of phytase family protein [Aquimixticola soesokkakensis]SLN52468.1 hypothetical protein AQS8620_02301 [Aquimixticola soesokkakensis]
MLKHLLLATCATALLSGAAQAEMNFNRLSSFAVPSNMAQGEDQSRETSAEIIAASEDGMTLIYTDSPLGVVGLIDITDAANPKPLGNIEMPGEPTSVAVIGQRAYVAVNTSKDYVNTSGQLVEVNLETREIVESCAIGGQPDSIALSKDGSFLVIAVENERDEDLGDGRTGQMPAGFVSMFNVTDGVVDCATLKDVDVTGLAEVSPEDPEPEFVKVNDLGETVVTMQENNHIVIIDKDGNVTASFSAGSVDLEGIDADDNGALSFTDSQMGRKREPDAVGWIDDTHFATANEGDMDGGARGWTIFAKDGTVVYESGASFEHELIKIGHYPDKRSDAKGVEPESIEVARFDGTPMVFVGSERGSAVGVYDVTDPSAPVLKQILPSGVGPEGYVAIPSRNLLISANESDLIEDGGARAHVMIFEYGEGEAQYPTITTEGMDELTGFGALSGLVADAQTPGLLYAVNDSFYKNQPTIFTIDATAKPAKITKAMRVTRDGATATGLDMEGITLDGQGGFWVASEGNTEKDIPHALYHLDATGAITQEVTLPEALLANEVRFGFEGVTMIGDTLWMAVQREWKDDAQNHVKLVAYTPSSGEWGAVAYEKAAVDTGWTGLSEITAHGDWVYIVERDNQIGDAAAIKKLYRLKAADMVPAPLGSELPVIAKEEVRDLIPDLKAFGGYVVDKVEGFAIDVDGEMFAVTDNDGVDDSSGETFFLDLGQAGTM